MVRGERSGGAARLMVACAHLALAAAAGAQEHPEPEQHATPSQPSTSDPENCAASTPAVMPSTPSTGTRLKPGAPRAS